MTLKTTPAKLKVVLVDIDETLFDTKAFAKRARMAALRAMKREGMKTGVERAYKVLMAVVEEHGPNYSDHFGKMLERLGEGKKPPAFSVPYFRSCGNRPRSAHAERGRRERGPFLPEAESGRAVAAGIFAYHSMKGKIAPFGDSVAALRAMRRAGLKVYAASEGRTLKQWDKLLRMGVHGELDGAFISEEIGVAKSVEYYRRIVRLLGVKPDEVLMIGDKTDRDVVPARKAGLHALLIARKGVGEKGTLRSLKQAAKIAIEMRKG